MYCCSRILGAVLSQVFLVISLGSLAGCASADLEEKVIKLNEQTEKLEQMAGKRDAENANLSAQVRESLKAQDVKYRADRDQLQGEVNHRLDEINRKLELFRMDIIDAVQKTNGTLLKGVDTRFDSLDVVIGTILLRIEELEKRPPPSKK